MSFLDSMVKKYKRYKLRKEILKIYKKCSEKIYLTEWERNFIKSIKDNFNLSEKQLNKLQEIANSPDVPRIRGRTFSTAILDASWDESDSDPRFCEKYSVSYDDVHDFDR